MAGSRSDPTQRGQIPLALHPPRRPTFENFIAGPNQAAVDTLGSGLESGSWYFLTGPQGSGRSHLLAATQARLTGEGQIVQFAALVTAAGPALLDSLTGDWVLLDDVDALAGKGSAEQALFNALNRWRDERTGVIMTGAGRAGIKLPDLRSRLGQATRLTLHALDETDLAALIRQVACEHEVALGRGVVDFLVTRLPRNPGTVASAIQLLAVRALSERRTLSVPLARKVLVDQ